MNKEDIKISFGIIVLNGEPFIKYNLRSLYPFAHEIIVVEGANVNAKSIATKDGHSLDNTLQILHDFKKNEDLENKLKIITREGFWEEKDEQSQAYAKVATGNYLWQIDADEFYLDKDVEKIIKILNKYPEIDTISFKQMTFWGGIDKKVDSWYLRMGADTYHRLFKWRTGYKYQTHRPPTVGDEGGVDLRQKNWISPSNNLLEDVNLYHYSLLFPLQVEQKIKYYSNMSWGEYSDGSIRWGKYNFLSTITKPFLLHNVHTHAGWIDKFNGEHPEQVKRMMHDIKIGRLNFERRNNDDIEKLLNNNIYKIFKIVFKIYAVFAKSKYTSKRKLSKLLSYFEYDYKKDKFFLNFKK